MTLATAQTLREDEISSPDAAIRAGISYRQLDYWCRRGVLGGAHLIGPGSGAQRHFTEADVVGLRACGRLSRMRADVEAMASLAAAIRGADLERLPMLAFVDVDGTTFLDELPDSTAGWLVLVD